MHRAIRSTRSDRRYSRPPARPVLGHDPEGRVLRRQFAGHDPPSLSVVYHRELDHVGRVAGPASPADRRGRAAPVQPHVGGRQATPSIVMSTNLDVNGRTRQYPLRYCVQETITRPIRLSQAGVAIVASVCRPGPERCLTILLTAFGVAEYVSSNFRGTEGRSAAGRRARRSWTRRGRWSGPTDLRRCRCVSWVRGWGCGLSRCTAMVER